ncbi:hypothetical protein APV28_3062 [Comamonas testosteroni]|nr:hypothetical protein APV28_3062 [Comamonas testosteroni]
MLITIDTGDLDEWGRLSPLLVLVPLIGVKSRCFCFTVATASYLRASRVMKCMSDSLVWSMC